VRRLASTIRAAEMTTAVTHHRPSAVRVTLWTLVFLGVTSMAGGIALVFGIGAMPPDAWLDRIPVIDSWIAPGAVLGVGFGLGSFLAAYGVLRRPDWAWTRFTERFTHRHWSWHATVLIGLGHVAWIAVELVYLPQLSVLQVVYGAVGITLVLLPLHPDVRGYLTSARSSRT
jgi:hypothetical protein